MGNSIGMFLIGGIIVTAFLVGGGVFNLKRLDSKAAKANDSLASTANRVWAYLIPRQQEELNQIHSLLLQEEWVEKNVEPSVMQGVNAERILIELANRGLVVLGQGTFRRHASAIDFIEPRPVSVKNEDSTEKYYDSSDSEDIIPSENTEEKEKEMEAAAVETPKNDLPVILLSSDTCSDCVHIREQFQGKATQNGSVTR